MTEGRSAWIACTTEVQVACRLDDLCHMHACRMDLLSCVACAPIRKVCMHSWLDASGYASFVCAIQ